MNIDFNAEPLFSIYVVMLLISGIAMVAVALVNFAQTTTGWRVINAIAGVAFASYAIYLGWFFTGGEYRMFIYAFILPVILIARAVSAGKAAKAQQRAQAQAQFQNPGAAYNPNAVAYNPNAAAYNPNGVPQQQQPNPYQQQG
ncbi:hypothetical protein C7C46_32880 [Streptomyces tateyamensis]|uniref:Uncharacterized protein n=1 Tax=Streptomyces tateyamensis TaxID=565073 RepID=A0A2V4NGP5_9ACTN|nr:hypothetical protein [Streptomyces tateyamensis]PYC64746.1 hypothetical protein C7C46_32880 [Streptomyces tateyamensis]